VVGNSSSGLAEAPCFKKGRINIGDRQRGRLRAESVINCEPSRDRIAAALEQLLMTFKRACTKLLILMVRAVQVKKW
jgi:GDP/UDP-N,N'-diacetylbacillosamine 2-epimerase (hydrolysing)